MYPTATGAADSATRGYVDTAVSGFSGLLTGGSIRKIWAGGKATNTVSHDAVITDAIILGGVFAIVIIPPVRGLGSTFDIAPCVLSPVATSDGRILRSIQISREITQQEQMPSALLVGYPLQKIVRKWLTGLNTLNILRNQSEAIMEAETYITKIWVFLLFTTLKALSTQISLRRQNQRENRR